MGVDGLSEWCNVCGVEFILNNLERKFHAEMIVDYCYRFRLKREGFQCFE